MKKKSLIFFTLALALSLCLALVACGDKNGGVNKLTAESGITLDGAFENGSVLKAEHHAADSEQGKAAIAAIDKPYDSAKIAVFEIFRYVNGLARFRRCPHSLVVKFRAVHNLVCRDHEVRKTCRFKRYIIAVNRGFEFFRRVVALDMIGDVNVRLERFRHGNLHLAARLYFLAALGKADVKNGNPCAVVRLVDCRDGSLALFAVRGIAFGIKRRAAFKRAVCGNAVFGGQFVYGFAFLSAANERETR